MLLTYDLSKSAPNGWVLPATEEQKRATVRTLIVEWKKKIYNNMHTISL